eukprot:gene357-biopygen4608
MRFFFWHPKRCILAWEIALEGSPASRAEHGGLPDSPGRTTSLAGHQGPSQKGIPSISLQHTPNPPNNTWGRAFPRVLLPLAPGSRARAACLRIAGALGDAESRAPRARGGAPRSAPPPRPRKTPQTGGPQMSRRTAGPVDELPALAKKRKEKKRKQKMNSVEQGGDEEGAGGGHNPPRPTQAHNGARLLDYASVPASSCRNTRDAHTPEHFFGPQTTSFSARQGTLGPPNTVSEPVSSLVSDISDTRELTTMATESTTFGTFRPETSPLPTLPPFAVFCATLPTLRLFGRPCQGGRASETPRHKATGR